MENNQLNTPNGAVRPTGGNNNQPVNTMPVNPQPITTQGDSQLSTGPSTETKNKKHTGRIIGIIICIIVLLGGVAFATFAVIKNQPENIAAESFSNLLNAKQVGVSGTINYTPKEEYADTIGQVMLSIGSKTVDANFSSDLNASITIPNLEKTIEFSLGEVMLKDGVFYAKVGGITKIYEEIISDMIDEYFLSSMLQNGSFQEFVDCVANNGQNESTGCIDATQVSIDPATMQALNNVISRVKATLEGIIEKVDDQWIEFSISDILDSDYFDQYIDQATKASINKAYDCSIELKNNISKYSEEFSDLYSQNKFVTLEPSTDSFYRISLKSAELANYVEGIPNTRAFADYMSCNGATDASDIGQSVSTEEIKSSIESSIESSIKNIPDVYARFDGFLDHHLTELKVEKDSSSGKLFANFNFTYPSNLEIAAPTDSTPVMELVKDIESDISKLIQDLGSL